MPDMNSIDVTKKKLVLFVSVEKKSQNGGGGGRETYA